MDIGVTTPNSGNENPDSDSESGIGNSSHKMWALENQRLRFVRNFLESEQLEQDFKEFLAKIPPKLIDNPRGLYGVLHLLYGMTKEEREDFFLESKHDTQALWYLDVLVWIDTLDPTLLERYRSLASTLLKDAHNLGDARDLILDPKLNLEDGGDLTVTAKGVDDLGGATPTNNELPTGLLHESMWGKGPYGRNFYTGETVALGPWANSFYDYKFLGFLNGTASSGINSKTGLDLEVAPAEGARDISGRDTPAGGAENQRNQDTTVQGAAAEVTADQAVAAEGTADAPDQREATQDIAYISVQDAIIEDVGDTLAQGGADAQAAAAGNSPGVTATNDINTPINPGIRKTRFKSLKAAFEEAIKPENLKHKAAQFVVGAGAGAWVKVGFALAGGLGAPVLLAATVAGLVGGTVAAVARARVDYEREKSQNLIPADGFGSYLKQHWRKVAVGGLMGELGGLMGSGAVDWASEKLSSVYKSIKNLSPESNVGHSLTIPRGEIFSAEPMAPLQPDGDSFQSVPMQSFPKGLDNMGDNAPVQESVTTPPAEEAARTAPVARDGGSVPRVDPEPAGHSATPRGTGEASTKAALTDTGDTSQLAKDAAVETPAAETSGTSLEAAPPEAAALAPDLTPATHPAAAATGTPADDVLDDGAELQVCTPPVEIGGATHKQCIPFSNAEEFKAAQKALADMPNLAAEDSAGGNLSTDSMIPVKLGVSGTSIKTGFDGKILMSLNFAA